MADKINPSYYKEMPISPIEFIVANKIGFLEGNIIKYVSRYKEKNGIEDLKKAKWYIEALIQLEKGLENGSVDKTNVVDFVRNWVNTIVAKNS